LGEVSAPVAARGSSTEAYEQYLIGQQAISRRTRTDIDKARACFEKSLALDPEFLPAITGLAESFLLLSNDDACYGEVPISEALAMARPLLDRAIMLYPKSEEVHASHSFYYHLSGDSKQAQFHAERAIKINPNCSKAYRLLGLILKRSGNPHALIVTTREKALHLDPASPIDLINLFGEMPARTRFKEAVELLDRIKSLEPGSIFDDWGRFSIAWNQGNIKQALAIYIASRKLLQDRQWYGGIQMILTLFGYGAMVEALDLPSALKIYCQYGFREDANRVANGLNTGITEKETRIGATTLAHWHVQEGRFQEADSILRPLALTKAADCGKLFDIDEFCLGARLSWFACKKLGNLDECALLERKLKELYSVRLFDHEGVHTTTNYIGACIASMENDSETALREIGYHVKRFPGSSIMIFRIHYYRISPTSQSFKNLNSKQRITSPQKRKQLGILVYCHHQKNCLSVREFFRWWAESRLCIGISVPMLTIYSRRIDHP
jgi:tetratricopeptide (TPR) repeat protein